VRPILAISLIVLGEGLAAPAQAQRDSRPPGVHVEVAAATPGERDRPVVAVHGVLNGSKVRDLMLNAAFPVRLAFRLDLWKKNAWVDDLKGSTEWDVLVSFDPTSKRFAVRRRHGTQTEQFPTFASIDDAVAFVELPYHVPQIERGTRGQQYYYSIRLDVVALQSSDLEAVQRWLKGDLEPVIRGKRNPVSAVREGIGTFLSRVIGGDRRRYEDRSAIFTAG
jgi:hypothetical protein